MVIADDHVDPQFLRVGDRVNGRNANVNRDDDLGTLYMSTIYAGTREAEPNGTVGNEVMNASTDFPQEMEHHSGARRAVNIIVAMDPNLLALANGEFDSVHRSPHVCQQPW